MRFYKQLFLNNIFLALSLQYLRAMTPCVAATRRGGWARFALETLMDVTAASSPRKSPQPAARPVSPLLYPTLLIAGISVIVASLLGIAAMTGLLPTAQSQPAAAPAGNPAVVAPRPPPPSAPVPARKAATKSGAVPGPCAECGVVESVRAIEVRGEGSGVGAVAGGVVGGILGNQVGGGRGRTAMTVVGAGAGAYAGHELEKNMKRGVRYEIRVRMDDRSHRIFQSAQPDVGVGQRVTVKGGQLAAAG
jgi:outer membrane lipoprotein SlyB